MTTTINVPSYGKIFATAENFDELRNISPTLLRPGYWALCAGANLSADGLGGLFSWNDLSSADDNSETVIRPTKGTAQGRWEKIAVGQVGPVGPLGPMGPQGIPGAAQNVAASLSQLKSSPVSSLTMLFEGSAYAWTPGDFSGQADDDNIVLSDHVPANGGAWVRGDTARQQFLSAQGGTDNTGVVAWKDAARGRYYFGGTDATPQNDEANLWATIMSDSPTEGLNRSPTSADQGVYSAAFGRNSYGIASYSYAFGHDNLAFGVASIVGGAGSVTGDPTHPKTGVASFLGYCSLAWGKVVQAIGQSSVAIGERCIAYSRSAVALGYKAIGQGSPGAVALGNDVQTASTGDWSAAIGQYVRNSGDGASAIGRGVNPGSPLNNGYANTLGFGMDALRPTLLIMPGKSSDSYTGKVGTRAGIQAVGDVGAAIDKNYGGIYWPLVNGGGGGYSEPTIKGMRAGAEETYLRMDGVTKSPQFFGDRVILGTARNIPTSVSNGVAGELCWDTNYIYLCVADNTWKRIAYTESTW